MPDSEPRRLTLDEREVFSIDWSGDGRRIVYSSGQDGSTNLFAVAVSGGLRERPAVSGANPTALSISPNGNRLVYEGDLVDSDIWRVPGPNSSDKTTAPSRFIASTEMDREPQFSPDGTKIVFTSARSGNYELWLCDAKARNPVQLTTFNSPDVGSPRWSPDSRWIAFDSAKAGNWDIYVINAQGGKRAV
jgi:Tol biopolymer transport system component